MKHILLALMIIGLAVAFCACNVPVDTPPEKEVTEAPPELQIYISEEEAFVFLKPRTYEWIIDNGDGTMTGVNADAAHPLDALDELGFSYTVTPGVSSFCGAAAAARAEYTLPGVSQSVILTRMAGEGLGYAEVLPDAQAKGYAEANPTAGVEGFDSAYKISILGSLAFNSTVDVTKVIREGITEITSEDISYAKKLGYVVKLVAMATLKGEDMLLRVHPAFLPAKHPLASVDDVFNAIYVKALGVGEVMFYGPGAGSLAAGAAVVGDVMDIAHNIMNDCNTRVPYTCADSRKMLGADAIVCKNYIRIIAEDNPGVLSSITGITAANNISIEAVTQCPLDGGKAEIVLLTHEAKENDVIKALAEIGAQSFDSKVASRIRVAE